MPTMPTMPTKPTTSSNLSNEKHQKQASQSTIHMNPNAYSYDETDNISMRKSCIKPNRGYQSTFSASRPFVPSKTHHHFQKRRKNFCCVNCGKEGHVYKQCKEPITSFGIIAFKRDFDHKQQLGPFDTITKHFCPKHKHIRPDGFLSNGMDNYNIIYLMVQRKDTIGFIDFIRGKYPESNPEMEKILKVYLEEMTCEERLKLSQENFENLWDMLWINKLSLLYINEYMEAKEKFNKLDVHRLLNETKCHWTEQEYGFPKGRKNMHETNLDCAIREFKEETGFASDQIRIVNDKPWEETFTGTNGVRYRHVYYIAEIDIQETPRLPLEDVRLSGEISNLGWFSYEQCIDIIRPYDVAKKELITQIHNKYSKLFNR